MSERIMHINGRAVGAGHPVYVIAEMSANHSGCLDNAVRIVKEAKACGADAVKLQTYTPDTLTIDCNSEHFKIKGTAWDGRTLYELYAEASTPWEWHGALQDVARDVGIDLFSSPFDDTAVDFLEELDVPAYKIASFEILDLPLLRRVAATGKPVILSTGMSTLGEIEEAVECLHQNGANEVALLKCTSAYPSPVADMHLRNIPHLAATFGLPAGLSDHSLSNTATVAAVALGANIVEKHFTLSRADGGPDSGFSLEPHEFKRMVHAVREAERALGRIRYGSTRSELASLVFRRSLFVVKDMTRGERFTRDNVRSIRPGNGLHPRHMEEVLGAVASRDLKRGTPLCWTYVEGA